MLQCHTQDERGTDYQSFADQEDQRADRVVNLKETDHIWPIGFLLWVEMWPISAAVVDARPGRFQPDGAGTPNYKALRVDASDVRTVNALK